MHPYRKWGVKTVCVVFMGAHVTDLVSADPLPDNRGLRRVQISARRQSNKLLTKQDNAFTLSQLPQMNESCRWRICEEVEACFLTFATARPAVSLCFQT